MVGTFLRHGSNVWLALGLAALIVCFAAGILPFYFSGPWSVRSFYVSEYGFHRFAFHAEPSRLPSSANCSTGCTTIITPSPIGSTFCSCRSGFSFPISR